MSDNSYHPPPIVIPIPQSSDFRTYYFNWCLTRSLSHSFAHLSVRHICHYHPFLNYSSIPSFVTQCVGTHRFEFIGLHHGFPLLVVQFTINPLFFTFSPLVSVFIFNPFFNHFYRPTCPTVPTLSLCFPMSPYASLCDLYDLNVFPYNVDTHTPFPLSLLTTIHKIPRARSIGGQLWTT